MSISREVLDQIAAGKVHLSLIASALSVEKKAIVKAVQVLKRRGLITVLGTKEGSNPSARGTYALTNSGKMWADAGWPVVAGQGARPRMRTGGLREKVWWHFRAYKTGSIKELLSSYADGTEKDAQSTLYKYLIALEQVEVIRRRDRRLPATQGRGAVQWDLVIDLGPQAPVWRQQEEEVYDPNSGCKYPTTVSTTIERRIIQAIRAEIEKADGITVDIDCDSGDFMQSASRVFSLIKISLGYAGHDKVSLCNDLFSMSKVTSGEDEFNWLKFSYSDCTPSQFKFTFGMWVLSTISRLNMDGSIRVRSLASLHEILHLLSFETNKPLFMAWQQTTGEIWKWQAKVLPEVGEELKARNAAIYFVGSAGISFKHRMEESQAPEGELPEARHAGSICEMDLITILNPRGHFATAPMGNMIFKVIKGTATAEDLQDLIKQLLLNASTPIFLILERTEINNSKLIRELARSQRHRLKLFYIPALK